MWDITKEDSLLNKSLLSHFIGFNDSFNVFEIPYPESYVVRDLSIEFLDFLML